MDCITGLNDLNSVLQVLRRALENVQRESAGLVVESDGYVALDPKLGPVAAWCERARATIARVEAALAHPSRRDGEALRQEIEAVLADRPAVHVDRWRVWSHQIRQDPRRRGAYLVESRSRPGTYHRVTAETGGLRCTCLGFHYRGRCRHVEEIARHHLREVS